VDEKNPYASPESPASSRAADLRFAHASASRVRELLASTRPWVMFLGIVLAMFGGLILLVLVSALGVALYRTRFEAQFYGPDFRVAAGIGTAYLILIVVLFLLPSVLLLRYSRRIGAYLREGSPDRLVEAMRAQQAWWIYLSLILFVLLSIGLLTFVGIYLRTASLV